MPCATHEKENFFLFRGDRWQCSACLVQGRLIKGSLAILQAELVFPCTPFASCLLAHDVDFVRCHQH